MNAVANFFSTAASADDRLSPILVKELRQGMRARIFVLSFLLLQFFLVILTLGNFAAEGDRFAIDQENGFFWTILILALLVFTPLRGLVAISQEVKNRTLETIMLTRLTAWRVVAGKWSALFGQSLLLISAVLPYVVIRYFIGGEDVIYEFELILLLLWLSGVFSAVSIAISALASPVIRILILIAIAISALTGMETMVLFGSGASRLTDTTGWLVIMGFFIVGILFELTASSIAPQSENHAIRRRLLALAFLLVAAAWDSFTRHSFEAGLGIAFVTLVGVCYFELAEAPRLLSRMAQSFGRRGPLGKIAGLLLLPGWPSGLLFSLLVIPGAFVLFDWLRPAAKDPAGWLPVMIATLGSILMPLCICHLFFPKVKQVLLVALFYNLILLAVSGLCETFATLLHQHVTIVLAFFPSLPTYVTLHNAGNFNTEPDQMIRNLFINGIVVALLLLVLVFQSRAYFRSLFQIYRQKQAPSAEAGR